MRQARIKPLGVDTFMHLYNRVAGHVGEFPFGPDEKEYFISLMRKLLRLYTLEVVAYQVMGNHFHLLAFIPGNRSRFAILSPSDTPNHQRTAPATPPQPIGVPSTPTTTHRARPAPPPSPTPRPPRRP